MMKSKEQLLVEAMMSEKKVDITESADRKFKNALANKINQQVSKEYEVQDKAEEMLEKGSLGNVVINLKSIDEKIEVAERSLLSKIEQVKANIEDTYENELARFYRGGGIKGSATEAIIKAEMHQALANVLEHEQVEPLHHIYKQLEVEKKACKMALQSYFDKNKKVIMEEMQKKKDEEMRESIRTSGILDMID